MISNDRIDELASDNVICVVSWDERIAMAREIQAYRKAFSEPVAYEWKTNTGFGVSKEIPKIPDDCYISVIGLYRKPTIPE